jgi:hypothetical protein
MANIIKEGQRDEKSIVIRLDELIDFIHTTKATFGVYVGIAGMIQPCGSYYRYP